MIVRLADVLTVVGELGLDPARTSLRGGPSKVLLPLESGPVVELTFDEITAQAEAIRTLAAERAAA